MAVEIKFTPRKQSHILSGYYLHAPLKIDSEAEGWLCNSTVFESGATTLKKKKRLRAWRECKLRYYYSLKHPCTLIKWSAKELFRLQVYFGENDYSLLFATSVMTYLGTSDRHTFRNGASSRVINQALSLKDKVIWVTLFY